MNLRFYKLSMNNSSISYLTKLTSTTVCIQVEIWDTHRLFSWAWTWWAWILRDKRCISQTDRPTGRQTGRLTGWLANWLHKQSYDYLNWTVFITIHWNQCRRMTPVIQVIQLTSSDRTIYWAQVVWHTLLFVEAFILTDFQSWNWDIEGFEDMTNQHFVFHTVHVVKPLATFYSF